MKTLIVNLLKLACIVAYAAALATTLGWMSSAFGSRMQFVALVLLGLHVLELGLAWKHLGRYAGPFGMSVLLTLLFGVLHWKPLADAAKAAESKPTP